MQVNEKVERFHSDLLAWADGNLRSFPWRSTTDPYRILITEVLLQKTPAERVEILYPTFFEAYPSVNALAGADYEEVAAQIETLGLHNKRGQALVTIGRRLEGKGVPDEEDALLQLPFVGKYVANATLCFAFDQSRPIVDSNVVRVFDRCFGGEFGDNDPETWSFAKELLPSSRVREYNLALLDFGATVCTPTSPLCSSCYWRPDCVYANSLQ